MAKRTIFDVMPYRYTEWVDEPDGTFSIVTHQDAQQNIDQTRMEYNNFGDKLTPGKRGRNDGFHKVASIPLTVWEYYNVKFLCCNFQRNSGVYLCGANYRIC